MQLPGLRAAGQARLWSPTFWCTGDYHFGALGKWLFDVSSQLSGSLSCNQEVESRRLSCREAGLGMCNQSLGKEGSLHGYFSNRTFRGGSGWENGRHLGIIFWGSKIPLTTRWQQ